MKDFYWNLNQCSTQPCSLGIRKSSFLLFIASYLNSFLENGPNPNANICRDNVHQPETSETLELVDVELKKENILLLLLILIGLLFLLS